MYTDPSISDVYAELAEALKTARILGAAHAETMAGNSEEAAELIDSEYAPLDGQWADGPFIVDVMRACGLDPHDDTDAEWEGDVCDAYEDAFWAHLDTLSEPHDDDVEGPALGYCAEGCGQPAAFTIGKLTYCRDCDPHDQPHVNVSFG